MSASEFDIISTYFNKPGLAVTPGQNQCLPLGIGDDCALLSLPEKTHLALSMDILVEGVHFPENADSLLIAQRALAVNLSDLAAMGASPLAFTLGLALPEVNEQWLSGFSEGLSLSAQKYNCPLIGGDMSKGPLSISIQVHGVVPEGQAITRSGAKPGDKVYVTGNLGAAGLALKVLDKQLDKCTPLNVDKLKQAYYLPEPRLAAGIASRRLASAAIDISDGLLADLGHIASQSKVKISIELDALPLSPVVKAIVSHREAVKYALAAGDDYELALIVPSHNISDFEIELNKIGIFCSCIGVVASGAGVECIDSSGELVDIAVNGYQHF